VVNENNYDSRLLLGYYNALIDDTNELIPNRLNKDITRSVLRSYAKNISTDASYATILEDIHSNGTKIDEKTFHSHLDYLNRLFIIENVKAWSPKLRSKSVMRTSDTKQFVDPSIAAVALGSTPESLMNDLITYGFLFESLVIRDLRIYAQVINAKVYKFRDSSGLEIDAIVVLDDGSWGAIQIKLGASEFDSAALTLLKFSNLIDEEFTKKPSFLAIVTGHRQGYIRSDGVMIIPITCLKP
jgi:predicted AAA+ superfamily ATPase